VKYVRRTSEGEKVFRNYSMGVARESTGGGSFLNLGCGLINVRVGKKKMKNKPGQGEMATLERSGGEKHGNYQCERNSTHKRQKEKGQKRK